MQTVKKAVVQHAQAIRRKRAERKLNRSQTTRHGASEASDALHSNPLHTNSWTRLQRLQAASMTTLEQGSRQSMPTADPIPVRRLSISKMVGRLSISKMSALDLENIEVLRKCVLSKAVDLANRGVIAVPVVGWDGKEPGEQEALDRISFIFQAYKVKYYYYELLEMTRKMLMIGAMGMFYPNLPQQFCTALAITIVWLVLGLRLQPWAHPGLNALNFFSLSFQALVLCQGLLTKISQATEDSVTLNDVFMTNVLQIVLSVLIVLVPASILSVENNVDLVGLVQLRLRSARNFFVSLCSRSSNVGTGNSQDEEERWGGGGGRERCGGGVGDARTAETGVEVRDGGMTFLDREHEASGDGRFAGSVGSLPSEASLVIDVDDVSRLASWNQTGSPQEGDTDAAVAHEPMHQHQQVGFVASMIHVSRVDLLCGLGVFNEISLLPSSAHTLTRAGMCIVKCSLLSGCPSLAGKGKE